MKYVKFARNQIVHPPDFCLLDLAPILTRPVLTFMKDHKLWDEIGLSRAIHVFEAIMYSIQSDLSYIVIERLMSNLNLPMNDVVQGGNSIDSGRFSAYFSGHCSGRFLAVFCPIGLGTELQW